MASAYSVPQESARIFHEGVLENPLMPQFPVELKSLAKKVRFEGSDKPSIPVIWRFAESISALKAFEATMVNYLVTKKYGVEPANVTINTDHASLFLMSPLMDVERIHPDGKRTWVGALNPAIAEVFPNEDRHRSMATLHRALATNIYKTKDGRFYHTHGSMNPDPTLTALGLPLEGEPDDTYDKAVARIQAAVAQFTSDELDELMNEQHLQAGTTVRTAEEYFASAHGQANSKIGLYEVHRYNGSTQAGGWWQESNSMPSSPRRPLAGLKVVDLTRVIAGPTITRGLAELGASVMRVTSPRVTDMSLVHLDLNWGKWNTHLHLKEEADREKLRALIAEADVVVDGYRPGVMERLGFGREAIFEMVKDRERGIIHARENCYGWYGPWAHRSGWQQVSDACCGVSETFARAMGVEGGVTPIFPNSDCCTGVAGLAGVLQALVERAEKGGSYGVDTSLNYYSQWLVRSVGTYPDRVWEDVWARHGRPVYHHYHAMPYTLPATMKLLHQHDGDVLFRDEYFEERRSGAIGETFKVPKPVVRFQGKDAPELRFNVGTRGNGTDKPRWPEDLSVEVVV